MPQGCDANCSTHGGCGENLPTLSWLMELPLLINMPSRGHVLSVVRESILHCSYSIDVQIPRQSSLETVQPIGPQSKGSCARTTHQLKKRSWKFCSQPTLKSIKTLRHPIGSCWCKTMDNSMGPRGLRRILAGPGLGSMCATT